MGPSKMRCIFINIVLFDNFFDTKTCRKISGQGGFNLSLFNYSTDL